MEPSGSLPHTQQLNTSLLLEPMYPVYALSFFSLTSVLILRSHLRLGLSRGSFPSGISTKPDCAFLFIPLQATNHETPPPNHSFLIRLSEHLTGNADLKAPHYGVFCTVLSLLASQAKNFFLSPPLLTL